MICVVIAFAGGAVGYAEALLGVGDEEMEETTGRLLLGRGGGGGGGGEWGQLAVGGGWGLAVDRMVFFCLLFVWFYVQLHFAWRIGAFKGLHSRLNDLLSGFKSQPEKATGYSTMDA